MSSSIEHLEFSALRPRLLALLELHRAAPTEAARVAVTKLLEEVFLATTWHVARDLLENGWRPGFVTPAPTRPRGALRVVGGTGARVRASVSKRAGGAVARP